MPKPLLRIFVNYSSTDCPEVARDLRRKFVEGHIAVTDPGLPGLPEHDLARALAWDHAFRLSYLRATASSQGDRKAISTFRYTNLAGLHRDAPVGALRALDSAAELRAYPVWPKRKRP